MRPRVRRCVLLVAASLTTVLPLHAQDKTVIYRCTDARGALTVQNGTPCPKGTKQDKRVIDVPVVIPSYTSPPAIAPAPTAVAAPAAVVPPVAATPSVEPRPDAPPPALIAPADRLPPPPLYQCNTWDNDSYLSEEFEPRPRCVRLSVTGVNGDPNGGGGEACEMKYDLCSRVPDKAACDGWKQRQREIESTWRYAPGGKKRELQDEFARVTKILNDTSCAM